MQSPMSGRKGAVMSMEMVVRQIRLTNRWGQREIRSSIIEPS
jgi:hypothetical protein